MAEINPRPSKRARSFNDTTYNGAIDPALLAWESNHRDMSNNSKGNGSQQAAPSQDLFLQRTGDWADEHGYAQDAQPDEHIGGVSPMDLDSNAANHILNISDALDDFDNTFQQSYDHDSNQPHLAFQPDATVQTPQESQSGSYSQFYYDFATPDRVGNAMLETPPPSQISSFASRLRPEATTFMPQTPSRNNYDTSEYTAMEQSYVQDSCDRFGQFQATSLLPQQSNFVESSFDPHAFTMGLRVDSHPSRQTLQPSTSGHDDIRSPTASQMLPSPASSTSARMRQIDAPMRQPDFHAEHAGLQAIIEGVPQSQVDIPAWSQTNVNNTNASTPGQHLHPNRAIQPGHRRPSSQAGSNTSHTCSQPGCEKSFEKEVDLKHHERYHNGDAKKEVCSMCGKDFHFAKDLKRHVKTHTPKERHLLCNVIGCEYRTKGFQRKDHVVRHMDKVHRKAWVPEERQAGAGASA